MSVLVTGGAGYIGSHMVLELLDAGEKVVVLDNLSTGFRWAVAPGAALVVGDIADTDRVEETDTRARRRQRSSISPGRSWCLNSVADPLGYYFNNTVKSRGADRGGGRDGRQAFHLLLDRRGLRQPDGQSGRGERRRSAPMSPYGSLEADDRDRCSSDAAKAHDFRYVALRYFNVAGADPRAGRASRRRARRI